MDLIRHFQFLRPAWLLALPLLWGLGLWLARRRSSEGGWAQLIDPDLLASLRLDGGGKRGTFAMAVAGVGVDTGGAGAGRSQLAASAFPRISRQ